MWKRRHERRGARRAVYAFNHALDAVPYAKRTCSATVSDVWVDLGKVSTIE